MKKSKSNKSLALTTVSPDPIGAVCKSLVCWSRTTEVKARLLRVGNALLGRMTGSEKESAIAV